MEVGPQARILGTVEGSYYVTMSLLGSNLNRSYSSFRKENLKTKCELPYTEGSFVI